MIGAVACTVIGLLPGTAQAQCQIAANPAASLSGLGWIAVNGWVYDTGCTANITVRSEVWINGFATPYCMDGSVPYGAAQCKDDDPNWAEATAGKDAYGVHEGVHRPIWRDSSNNSWHILPDTYAFLNGGTQQRRGLTEEECQEDPEYYWDYGTESCIPLNTPILIPLARAQAIKLTSAADGVLFDIDADGALDRVAWTQADANVAFLAIDRNGNGSIDNGAELFGNHTVPGALNGFDALEQMNRALNGGVLTAYIDMTQPLYARLLLWVDRNHDGVSQPDELRGLDPLLSAIGLGYRAHNRRDGHGNLFRWRGFAFVRTAPGRNVPIEPDESKARQIDIYDVIFKVQ